MSTERIVELIKMIESFNKILAEVCLLCGDGGVFTGQRGINRNQN